MLFNSSQFIFIFLPVVFFGYFFFVNKRLVLVSKTWLVGASLVFYSWWNPVYLPLILSSMLVNYSLGASLGKDRARILGDSASSVGSARKRLLVSGLVFNLGLLGYFKYTDFFIENFNGIFGADIPLQHIALPLAISFFTFQQIAYLVDSYRGETQEYDFLNYALFVTFFPQLIAGPIVHHKEMMPQFASRWHLVKRYRNIAMGLFIFTLGLFKKVVIADTFADWANEGFDESNYLSFFEAWSTSLSYTFQLYFDFSGYTDMAIGAALLFNIRLPINFNSPYKAHDIQDFWRRWHMTLSRFLRDYIYIPLGGNRVGRYRVNINLFITFLLGGLWHGASWMFVIWGAAHGAALVIHRVWQQLGFRMWSVLAWCCTFLFVNTTWIFFRATDMAAATKVLEGLVRIEDITRTDVGVIPTTALAWGGLLIDRLGFLPDLFIPTLPAFAAILLGFAIIGQRNSISYLDETLTIKHMVFAAILFVIAVLTMLGSTSEVFLYFNF
ncbi:membrane-bound O-acyltransferase family protein [Kineobactrum sediminis]|uniref:Probable alginate O-acetylase n=1 Tax=Kineobactrum sediminis TaxID=1905677 RepID=A0A2N5Y5T8_9GAMM|nr:MBOAT family protein [Kineobactrum sediminis]PLW83742.1 membrane-bound O-acyltransferase family protein [Kineobactrum sediminis]